MSVRVEEWYVVLKHYFTAAYEGSELERSYCVFYWVFAYNICLSLTFSTRLSGSRSECHCGSDRKSQLLTCSFRARQVAKNITIRIHGTTAAILKNLTYTGVASLAQNLHS